MKTDLDFEDERTKELLAKLDFEYFLKQNIEEEKYAESDIAKIHDAYRLKKQELKSKSKTQKRQFNYYLEGQVRKMFTGGFLPAIFHLDKSKSTTLFRFEEIGEDWAYFQLWSEYYRRKLTKEKVWNLVIKTGSLLAILLSAIKLWEFLFR